MSSINASWYILPKSPLWEAMPGQLTELASRSVVSGANGVSCIESAKDNGIVVVESGHWLMISSSSVARGAVFSVWAGWASESPLGN